jgi:LuxR family maltose regulon positive regulatory protein
MSAPDIRAPILATKLYIPPLRDHAVARQRLVARVEAGTGRGLTLISAPAGFGKTTLLSAWVAASGRPVAWLSLDAEESDPARFLTYLIAALQTARPGVGEGALGVLQVPQPPPVEAILTSVINEIAAAPQELALVLDDYHRVESAAVDQALSFLVAHLPPQMQLVIATREDPPLPLARLRAAGRLIELRAADLRFTPAEAAAFLRQAMGIDLPSEQIATLEARTEGWPAGLQLAALSLQAQGDTGEFVQSFAGSHRYVLDYLVEEVLQHQAPYVQEFLLRTAILDRLCGPLCDAVVHGAAAGRPAGAPGGEEMLRLLERDNLFLVPLDDQRRWYRYHHLFGDLLRQRLRQSLAAGNPAADGAIADGARVEAELAVYHLRASRWYEENGQELEAFQHAVAAHDIDRAMQLAEGKGMPLHFRGAVAPVQQWLESLPPEELDVRPALWTMYASIMIYGNRLAAVEEKLQRAEAALRGAVPDEAVRNLWGHIAAMRATVAVSQHDAETIVFQAQQALAYLLPQNLPVRTAMTWALGYAHELRGERAAARAGYQEVIAISEKIGHFIMHIMATLGLGHVQEGDNQLQAAAGTYGRVLQLAGDPPLGVACGGHLGLARIAYARNDLAAAEAHAQVAVQLARQIETTDRYVACELFQAQLRLAAGDLEGAAALTMSAKEAVQRQHFAQRAGDVAAMEVLILLRRGEVAAAAALAQEHTLPFSLARVHLAQGEPRAAQAVVAAQRVQAEAQGWADVRLQALVLEAAALAVAGDASGLPRLEEALAVAEPQGMVRLFVDEGPALEKLLAAAAAQGTRRDYAGRLLVALAAEGPAQHAAAGIRSAGEPANLDTLSEREREVLQLIAEGLSNQEIGARLFLALDTVKGHNRRIFEKLHVERRTEAVAKARALGLLPRDR